MIRGKFRIHRQLSELYRDHDVYIRPVPGLSFNDFVRISCKCGSKRKSIYVWLRFIDDYYRTFYNTTSRARFKDPSLLIPDKGNSIVLCRHYRVMLGIDEAALEGVELDIKKTFNPFYKLKALYNAPDSMVRITTIISIISVILGIIALVLGILSLR
jgi:hypothetical protein